MAKRGSVKLPDTIHHLRRQQNGTRKSEQIRRIKNSFVGKIIFPRMMLCYSQDKEINQQNVIKFREKFYSIAIFSNQSSIVLKRKRKSLFIWQTKPFRNDKKIPFRITSHSVASSIFVLPNHSTELGHNHNHKTKNKMIQLLRVQAQVHHILSNTDLECIKKYI